MSGPSEPQQSQVPKHRCKIDNINGRNEPEFCNDFHAEAASPLTGSRFNCRAAACQVCLDCNPNNYPRCISGSQSYVEISFMELVLSATDGCESCSVLEEGLRLWSLEISSPEKSYVDILPTGEIKILYLRDGPLRLLFFYRKEEFFSLQFYTLQKNSTPWPAFGTTRPMHIELNIEDCVSFIKERLAYCHAQHSCVPSPVSKLPTRIINVGSKERPISKLENGSGREANYIALSHCWGSPQTVMKTTKATLSARLEGISWTDLPKTFQDAIAITRLLDVQYLWIDSLCIIQDDPQDWQVECSLMQDVYSSSLLTLAATGALDSNVGCLFRRSSNPQPQEIHPKPRGVATERRSISPKEIHRVIGDEHFTVFMRCPPWEAHHHLLKADIRSNKEAENVQNEAPLMRRAWALQERLLSRRVVHFHSAEMLWQCRAAYACECGQLQLDVSRMILNRGNPLFNLWKPDQSVENILSLWYQLVNYYAQLSISYDQDRLPALSGLASHISSHLAGGYIAGLWRQDLVRGLLWRPNSHFGATSRIDDFNIPTWSWASVKLIKTMQPGPIVYFWIQQPPPDSRTNILEAHCSFAGSNVYGNVTTAFITIEGPVVFIKASNIRKVTGGRDFEHVEREPEIKNTIYIDIVNGGPSEIQETDVLCCIILAHVPDYRHREGWSTGLILKKTHSGLYFRVGTITSELAFFQDAEMKKVTII